MESLGVPRIPHQRLCAQLVLSLGDNGQCLGTYVAVICHICARNRWRPGSPPHPDSVCMAGRTLVHTGGTDLVISHPPPRCQGAVWHSAGLQRNLGFAPGSLGRCCQSAVPTWPDDSD